MTIRTYLWDKIQIILIYFLGVLFLYSYLLLVGNSGVTAGIIAIAWLTAFGVVLLTGYLNRRKFFREIDDILSGLDQPWLIQEFLGDSWRLEDKLYHDILYRSNKAVIEQIAQLREEQKEYREYLEGWIHEAKLPITGMRLACRSHVDVQRSGHRNLEDMQGPGHHNPEEVQGPGHRNSEEVQETTCRNPEDMQEFANRSQVDVRRLELYLSEMDHLVEQALFYARSEQVYKDFQINEIHLKELISELIRKNKYLLIQNNMNIQINLDDITVTSDQKWITFILMQILINAVKYKREGSASITFRVEEEPEKTKLIIRDNGIGIQENELERIFDKGYTGTNGRSRERSTGIGLYLCRKLCRKLEIRIEADSLLGEYTEISLSFPKSTYLAKM